MLMLSSYHYLYHYSKKPCPYEEVCSVLETVEASQASRAAKLCLRFLVLTYL